MWYITEITFKVVSVFFVDLIVLELIFLGAISRYPLQSIVPNTGTIGFSLLSGLGNPAQQNIF
jgi:hypothetical protein